LTLFIVQYNIYYSWFRRLPCDVWCACVGNQPVTLRY